MSFSLDPSVKRDVLDAWDDRERWDRAAGFAAGRALYEALQSTARPGWAARILSHCASVIDEPRTAIWHVVDLAEDPRRWIEAHDAFTTVRRLTLAASTADNTDASVRLLLLAENTAKVTYNASGATAPFDHNAGWRILPNAADFLAVASPDIATEARIRRAVVGE